MAIIIANGPLGPRPNLRRRLRKADLLICADGGLRAAQRVGIPPHIVVGDLDSAPPALVRWATSRGAQVRRHPVEKDKIDAELALETAIDAGASDVEFVGVLGGRLDHTLAGVTLLIKAEAAGVRAKIIGEEQEAYLARKITEISGRRGDTASLIPLTAVVTGVTLKHFRYPLRNATIRQGTTLTVSNVIETTPATVRIGRGRLLVVINHR
ncbi:MAG TPA: thiamine diphosphokinase [bacterium]|nr:thiamine diphosphokinase [bacterium]